MKIILQKQPNNFTCLATVCSMIVGQPIQDFYDKVGHDGSAFNKEIHPNDPNHFTAFNFKEAFKYLYEYNFFPYIGFKCNSETFLDDGKVCIKYEFTSEIMHIIDVESQRFEGCTHVILFHNGIVYDPNPEVGENPDLSKYKINLALPVTKF